MATGTVIDKKKSLQTADTKGREWLQEIQKIFSGFNEVTIKVNSKSVFHFRLHMTESMCKTLVEELNLSVRACHCLKRAGYNTLGELVAAIEEGVDLYKIRNCGRTSVQEIQAHLFLFQYSALRPERREEYLMETIALNCMNETYE